MAEIRVLDSFTIDQIAAGEVIERPVSVVKELVENALDAGADSITVELAGGGIDLIRVTDNGCGIPREQIPVAFARHATSKIVDAKDLFALTTLGFRGEALSSIASVAKVELLTRTADAESAVRYRIENGREISLEEAAAAPGTTFTVRDLFYNTPVRRKFLKSAQAEAAYVVTLMEQLCLSRPGISMRLIVNGQEKLRVNGSYRFQDVLFTLYGRETVKWMKPLAYEEKGIRVEGYFGLPTLSRGSRAGELTFVNGRFIKSALLMKAIEQAYHGLTMQHKFPMVVLQLEMEPSLLDVNVHPTKLEVRFREEKNVFDAVYHALREGLFGGNLIPAVSPETEKDEKPAAAPVPVKAAEEAKPAAAPKEAVPEKEEKETPASAREYSFPVRPAQLHESNDFRAEADRRLLDKYIFGSPAETAAAVKANDILPAAEADRKAAETAAPAEKIAEEAPLPAAEKAPEPAASSGGSKPVFGVQEDLFAEKILQPGSEKQIRLIGQLFDTYWLMEYRDEFLLCDQHAVHEKILFERTMKSLRQKEHTAQQLMPPRLMQLTGAQEAVWQKNRAVLESLGYEAETMGGRSYSLTAVPDNLFGLDTENLFQELLDGLAEERGTADPAALEAKVAMMSCKAAVKGQQALSFAEAEALLKELMTLENPYACPHGRPTMIRMSRRDLEKKFKRIV